MPVVDTSYLIAVEENDEDAVALARLLEDGGVLKVIPAIVWLEFLAGLQGRARVQQRRLLRNMFQFVPLDEAVGNVALDIHTRLLAIGRPMSWSDLQVAATALHLAEPLVTLDSDFKRIPELEVLTP